ncbi:iron(III) transport system permease protein [Luteibacter sp. UNCMF331Sha3.1]|uniref:ABC transporter permease subunit n=1 Tax=Luteibacter sp. UNCMF331Sha3.1 TaxID=1502760 RepID=UPI0008B48F52|nr:ABC transporter permease subunit [Luteibacter sp. UNCMF331Sha3.1]SEM17635.1 iron(III) transport system permease protein [Luteibacter sp. UNCMF331Sha3.1]
MTASARSRPRFAGALLLGVPALALLLFFVHPLATVLWRSVTDADGALTLANFMRLSDDPGLPRAAWHSVAIGLATTACTVPIGLVVAMALHRSRLRGKRLIRGVLVLPMLAPSLVLGLGLVCLLGHNGLVHRLTGLPTDIYGFWGLLLANTMYGLPQATIIVSAALARTPARHYDAATSMGATDWRQFVDVTLPRLRFALLAAAFLVFTETLTDFGSAVVVGGGYRVLAMEIYSEVVGQLDFAMGATLGVLLLAPALLSVWLGRMAKRRQDSGDASPGRPLVPAHDLRRDTLLGAVTWIALLPVIAVVATVAYVSLVKLWPYDRALTLANYMAGMPDGYGPVATSLGVSLLAACVGTPMVFALAAGLRRAPVAVARPVQFLASLPAAVPGMVLGLGYVLTFNHGPLSPWLYGSALLVAACSLYHYHAQSFLTMQTGMRQAPEALEDAVLVFGGETRHVLRDAILPFAAPAAVSTFFYLFMRSLVTLSGVIFLVTPELGLASVTVMRLDENGFLAQAAAYAMCVVLAGGLALGAMRLLLHLIKDRRHVA